jgi:Ca2+-binding EF-hand superfamily protein
MCYFFFYHETPLGRAFVFNCLCLDSQQRLQKNDFYESLLHNGMLFEIEQAQLIFRILDYEGRGHITHRAFQKIISPKVCQ